MLLKGIPSCLSIYSGPVFSNYSPKQQSYNKNRRNIKQFRVTRSPIETFCNGETKGLRVFVLSDLHTDYSENMAWVSSLSKVRYKDDVLLLAGDVAEKYNNFVLTMSLLKDRFEHVFYVPGNHDLWCRFEEDRDLDSLSKMDKLFDTCKGLGVETNPTVIDGLGIIPLFSWYHESFDQEEDITGIRIPPLEMVNFLVSLRARTFMLANGRRNLQNATLRLLYILMQ